MGWYSSLIERWPGAFEWRVWRLVGTTANRLSKSTCFATPVEDITGHKTNDFSETSCRWRQKRFWGGEVFVSDDFVISLMGFN